MSGRSRSFALAGVIVGAGGATALRGAAAAARALAVALPLTTALPLGVFLHTCTLARHLLRTVISFPPSLAYAHPCDTKSPILASPVPLF